MKNCRASLALVLSVCAAAGCELVTDFTVKPSEPGGGGGDAGSSSAADAGGRATRGGATARGGSTQSPSTTSTGGSTNAQGGSSAGGVTSISEGGSAVNAGGSFVGTGAATSTVATPKGGASSVTSGGATASGGTAPAGGTTSRGGSTSTGGSAPRGGSTSSGGTTSAGGSAPRGGSTASGGTTAISTASGGAITVPTVVSINPINGAKGVNWDAPVQIVFSEPMNATSVASALSISGFASSTLGLAWSANNTKVTVTTQSPGFSYATGNTNVTANSYTVALTTAAKDAEGTPLGATFASSFSSQRRFQYTLAPSQTASFDSFGATVYGQPPIACTGADTVRVGKWLAITGSGTAYAYLWFNLESIGTPSAIRSIEWANLYAEQADPSGSFYSGGYVFVEKLEYVPLESNTTVADGITYGVLATSFTPTAGLAITTPFTALFKGGATRLLLRVAPAGIYADNSFAYFTCSRFGLDLSYLSE